MVLTPGRVAEIQSEASEWSQKYPSMAEVERLAGDWLRLRAQVEVLRSEVRAWREAHALDNEERVSHDELWKAWKKAKAARAATDRDRALEEWALDENKI